MSAQPPLGVIDAAVSAMQATGVPASVLIAQWAQESGWGARMPQDSNNPFGEKAFPGQPCVYAMTHEFVNGAYVQIKAAFRKFTSIAEAFLSHATHLATSDYYVKAMALRADPLAFANALTGIYATDPNYGTNLCNVIRGSNLTQYDHAGPLSAPQTSA